MNVIRVRYIILRIVVHLPVLIVVVTLDQAAFLEPTTCVGRPPSQGLSASLPHSEPRISQPAPCDMVRVGEWGGLR